MSAPTDQDLTPVLLPGASGWDPDGSLTVTVREDAAAALGRVGPAVEVAGLVRFVPVVLKVPVDDDDVRGIDPGSVRVLHRLPGGGSAVVDASGAVPGLGHVWAIVTAPGVYEAFGLPLDPVAEQLVEDAAAGGRAVDTVPPGTVPAFREAVAADLAATDPDRFAQMERGDGFGVVALPLPGDIDDDELLRTVRDLERDRTPEQQLLVSHAETRTRVTRALPGVPASANWWMYHRDPEHTGVVTDSHLDVTTVGGLRPRYRLPLDGPVVSVPAVVDNVVYVGVGNSRRAVAGRGGTLYAIDLITGALRSSFTFSTPPLGGSRQGLAGIACTPAVVDGRVYFSGQDGKLYCLDQQTLSPVWVTDMRHADPAHRQPVTHQVNAEGWCSPLVVNGRVYVGWGESESNAFGFFYCLDAASGDVVWLFCTTLFPGVTDNVPNVIPRTAVGMSPLPPGFAAADDPPVRGGSPWSSVAYDAASDRVVVGTGNVLPQHPLPQPKYSLGVLSLDATTGGSPRFFQPANADNYRPDDSDVDMAASPLVYTVGGRRVVALGCKNGSFFVLDAASLEVLARRQLLPRAGGNGGFPGDRGRRLRFVDPREVEHGQISTENFYGTFSCPVVHAGLRRIFVGLGGFEFGGAHPGIDSPTTPFLRAMDWADLTDAWATRVGPDRVSRYVTATPPLYTTPGEAGFSSPVLVNDLVLMTTSRPALYGFDAGTGLAVYQAPGFGPQRPNSFTLGPAVYGDWVVAGSANLGLLAFSL
ncbi:PQQ-binding-like beta-propeller repeat protein [Cellulomonas chitinilytica]|nr:PQQ-binding-like beta-propeller repeat protein [Cellulomonas chitinilytica]